MKIVVFSRVVINYHMFLLLNSSIIRIYLVTSYLLLEESTL